MELYQIFNEDLYCIFSASALSPALVSVNPFQRLLIVDRYFSVCLIDPSPARNNNSSALDRAGCNVRAATISNKNLKINHK